MSVNEMIDDTVASESVHPFDDMEKALRTAPPPGTDTGEAKYDRETVDDMLRAIGLKPDDYEPARPLAELPKITNPVAMDTGYSEYAIRSMYDSMSDAEKIRTTAVLSQKDVAEVERVASELFATRTRRDIESLAFPENDIEAIVRDLVPGPIQANIGYVEEMMKTPEGKERLRTLWMETRTNQIAGDNSLEYQMCMAQVIDANEAVLMADYRRFVQDLYGGTVRTAANLGKDFIFGAARIANSGFWWSTNALARGVQTTAASTGPNRAHYPYGPLTKQAQEELDAPSWRDELWRGVSEYAEESAARGRDYWYRPESRTGSFAIDKVASPVAGGLGSVLASIGTFAVNPSLGWATMWGAAKREIYDQALADGQDSDTAHLVSDVGAFFSAALERAGAEKVVSAWRPLSPGARAFQQSLVAPTVGEGLTESAQSLVGFVSVEVGRSLQPGYEFDLGGFLAEAVPGAATEGIYGALTGGIAGVMGSRPVRTTFQHAEWRKAQHFLSAGVERLARSKAPDKLDRLATDIVEQSGAPQSMYFDPDGVRTYYQGDRAKIENALAKMDVTTQAYDHALEAGAQIEVPTSRLMQFLAKNKQDAELQKLAQASPDAPTMGVILQQEQDKAALAEEMNRLNRENKALPEPFRIFQEQLADAWDDSGGAVNATQLVYGMSRVAGARTGLTPEQFLDLHPIQIILTNGITRARSYGEIAAKAELSRFEREERAAQSAYVRYQAERKGRYEFVEAPDGGVDFGALDVASLSPALTEAGMESGPVRLERGNRQFGKIHIEREHSQKLAEIGFDTAEEFVQHVMGSFRQIRQGNKGRFVVVAPGEGGRLLVVNLHRDDGNYYTVTSGYVVRKGQALPGDVLWDMDATQSRDSGDPVRLLSPDTEQAGGIEPLSNDGQSISSIGSIPVDGADVKQWDQAAMDTLLEQSGVTPEQAESFIRYAESVLGRGGDIADAGALGREVQTAIQAAEGLEQAAAGLERILAEPSAISQAVFDALDIDAATVQEGIAAIQERVADLGRRAQAFRNFHQDPETLERVRRAERLQQDVRQRGDVTLTPDINVIRLFNGRQDRSTIMHELFHIYYRHLEQAAKKGGADTQVMRDFLRLNDEIGGGLVDADPEVRRTAEEWGAGMFEKYLSEGVAPSPFLAEAFRRFRTWITNIYRQVKEFAGINLTPETRGVFDRMIAGEAEIEYAREYYNDFANLTAPQAAPERVRKNLEEKAEAARRTAEDMRIARVVKEYMKAVGGRRAIRQRAREELSGVRQYQAIQALKEMGGLTREQVVAEIGEAGVANIERNHRGIIRAKAYNTVGALDVAENFGYDSLVNLLSDVAATENLGRAITAMTDGMVEAEEAEIRRIAAEDAATPADEEYHNDAYSDYFAAKQRALDALAAEQAAREGRKADRMMSNRAIREAAEYNNSQKTGHKAGQYHIEVAAFKRHSESAMKAEKAGDTVTAAKEWRLMRMAHHGIRAAIRSRHDLAAFQDRMHVNDVVARLEGRNRHHSAPVEFPFRETIKDMITTFKVAVSHRLRPERPVGERIAIPGHNLTPEAEAMLPSLAMAVPEWIAARDGADSIRTWRDLTMERIRELDVAIRDLEKLGRGTLQALKQPGIESREQLKRESIARMSSRPERSKIHNPKSGWGKFLNGLEAIGAKAFIPEYILAMADGNTNITGKGIGPLQNLALALREGLTRKSDMVANTMAKVNPAMRTLQGYRQRFKNLNKSRLGPLPENLKTAYGFTEWDAEMGIMFALNSGNAGNLKALLEGYGISREQWNAIAATFTGEEWRAVQTIWDAIGEYFEKIDAVTFNLVNRHVKRVEPQPFTVIDANGVEVTLDGGYFPLIFDALVEADLGAAQNIEMNLNKAHFNAIHTLARLANAFTIARQTDEQGNPLAKRAPRLDLDIVTSHIDKVAHYVALAEAIHEADLLTVDQEWADVFISRFGQRQYDTIRNYVKYVADPDSGNLGANDWGRQTLEWMRHKATVAALGFRFWTAMKQRLDYFPAALHMSLHSRTGASGFKYLIRGMHSIGWQGNLGIITDRIKAIYEKSAFMRDRDGNVTADMREIIARTTGEQKTYTIAGFEFSNTDLYNAAFKFMSTQDRAASSAVWLGAYEMALDGNGSFDPAGLSPEQLDPAAIKYADTAAATFAASTLADLTAWQRDKGVMRAFTTFMTGTVRRTSRLRQYADAVRRGQITKTQFLQAFVVDAAIQAWLPGFLYWGLKAVTGDDDDDESSMWDWFSTLFLDPAMTYVDGIPGLNMLNSARQYGASGAFTPAGQREFEKQLRKMFSLPASIKEGEIDIATWKAITIAGYAKGIPVEAPVRDVKKALKATGVIEK